MDWNRGEIRKLVSEALSDSDLQNLCFDHFEAVYEEFTSGQDKGSRILILVQYVFKQMLVPKLLGLIQIANPNVYAKFEPDLKNDSSDPRQYALAIASSTALEEKISRESDLPEKDRLKAQLESCQEGIRIYDQNLDGQKRENHDLSQFADDLPKIDFIEAMGKVNEVLESFRQQRGDVLFLLQQHLAMAGDLFLQRIQDKLKEVTGDFKPYKLDFYVSGNLSEHGWLMHLSRYFNLEDTEEIDTLIDLTIDKICNSVRSGSVILLEIHKWDALPSQKDTLTSFLQKFWIPLVARLDDKAKYPRVKFVAVLVVDAKLSVDCFQTPCLCGLDENKAFRWAELSLDNWTQEEIQEWLETYPGYDNLTSTLRAANIYQSSMNGIPHLVRTAIKREVFTL
jgi:hypothetical protein